MALNSVISHSRRAHSCQIFTEIGKREILSFPEYTHLKRFSKNEKVDAFCYKLFTRNSHQVRTFSNEGGYCCMKYHILNINLGTLCHPSNLLVIVDEHTCANNRALGLLHSSRTLFGKCSNLHHVAFEYDIENRWCIPIVDILTIII